MSAFLMLPVSTPSRLYRDGMSENPNMPPLRSLLAASNTGHSVPGSLPSPSSWVYREVIPTVCEELGSQLRAEIDTTIKRTVRQQLNALWPGVLDLEIQASLHIAQIDCFAALEKRVAKKVEKVAHTVIGSLLSDL